MGNKTDYLQLALLNTGEQRDTWGETLNANFVKIDENANSVTDEVVASRFDKASLNEFLAVGINSDGTLKPTPEVEKARSSVLYGDEAGATDFDLAKRLDMGDMEVFRAMEGSSSLRTSIARTSFMQNAVLQGTKDSNGYPTWMGFTGANVQVDGEVTNIIMLISGQKARVRVLEQIAITGAAGVKYLYALFNDLGLTRVTGTGSGSTGIDGSSKVRIFQDLGVDFTTRDVKPYDVLTISGTGADAGTYLVAEIAPGGNVNQLRIFGKFPGGSLAALSYTINDPLAVTLGFDTAKNVVGGKFYLGEADFDGAAVTAIRSIHFEDFYVGAWQAVNVTSLPQFDLVWNHNMFDSKLEVIVQASTANDDSAPIVPLDIGSLTDGKTLNFSNTLNFDPGVWNPGVSGASYSPLPALNGTVASSLNGAVILDNAVRVQFTTTKVQVKNPVAGYFFRDYAGAVVTTGYVRVLVRRKA